MQIFYECLIETERFRIKRRIPHMIGVYPKWSNFKAISYDMAFLFYSVKFQQKYAKVTQNTILNTTKSKFHINIFKKSVL